MNQTRSRAVAVLACLALGLVLTAPGALGDRDLYVGDTGHFEQPRDELVSARLRAGQGLPRWLPGVFGGSPALGGQELALFYPPNDLLLLVVPSRARVWGLLFHLVLAALGARALARRLGAGDGASLLTGVVYGFGGAVVSMNTVLVYARSAGWLPWVVLGLVRASAGERRGLALAVLALLGTYLGGDPLGCGFAALVGLLVTLALPEPGVAFAPGLARRARAVFPALALAALLTALLGALQLVPAAFATRESVRGAGMTLGGATQFSLHPLELVGLLVPFAFGAQADPETAWFEALTHERAWSEVLYVGPIALALALVALSPRDKNHRMRDDPLARAGLLVFVLFGLLALGHWTPLYALFFRLPGAGLFRYPAKLFLHASLGLALLAGSGAQALSNDVSGKLRQRSLYLLAGLGALALVASNVARLGSEFFATLIDHLGSEEVAGKEATAALAWRLMHVGFVALGGAFLLAGSRPSFDRRVLGLRLRAPSPRRLALGLAALVAVDLGVACRPAVILGPRAEVSRPPAVAALLAERAAQDQVPARVYPTFAARSETPGDLEEARARANAGGPVLLRDEGLLPNRGIAQGVLSQHGFLSNAPLRISVVSQLADELRRAERCSPAQAIALRGATYALVREDEASAFTSPGPGGGAEATVVGRVPGGRELLHLGVAPPWAAVFSRARFAPGIQEGLDALRSKDPRQEVVLEGVAPEPALAGAGQGARVPGASVRLVGTFEPERFELAVETPVRGWLVVREAFAGGWTASVGGELTPVLPADVAFRGVLVPKGSSRVVFDYEAPGASLGALVSLIAGLACLIAWLFLRKT